MKKGGSKSRSRGKHKRSGISGHWLLANQESKQKQVLGVGESRSEAEADIEFAVLGFFFFSWLVDGGD